MWPFSRVSEGSLKGRVESLERRLAKMEDARTEIDEIALDWARTKRALQRLAGQVTKTVALDVPPLNGPDVEGIHNVVERVTAPTPVDYNSLDREVIARMPIP